jgi:hypothetical protein
MWACDQLYINEETQAALSICRLCVCEFNKHRSKIFGKIASVLSTDGHFFLVITPQVMQDASTSHAEHSHRVQCYKSCREDLKYIIGYMQMPCHSIQGIWESPGPGGCGESWNPSSGIHTKGWLYVWRNQFDEKAHHPSKKLNELHVG